MSLPFDDEAAIVCGQIRARLARAGTPIGACDLLIAAIALANNLTLVTHNTREFGRVIGLQVEDWLNPNQFHAVRHLNSHMCEHLSKLGWLLSPSRKVVDCLKQGDEMHRGQILRCWNYHLFVIELVGCVALMALFMQAPSHECRIALVPVLYAFSRVNEIAYAFYRDSLSSKKKSDLKPNDRIRMAMRSYFGILFNFALFYYFLPFETLFKKPLANFLEAVYFSGVTLATDGSLIYFMEKE